jgi:uncharacterized membrane protein YbhN (UPF0104 family)
MSDRGWLVLAVVAGVLATTGWIARERWIQRRRRRGLDRKETRR